jgi:hypothetical protein
MTIHVTDLAFALSCRKAPISCCKQQVSDAKEALLVSASDQGSGNESGRNQSVHKAHSSIPRPVRHGAESRRGAERFGPTKIA